MRKDITIQLYRCKELDDWYSSLSECIKKAEKDRHKQLKKLLEIQLKTFNNK